MTASKIKRTLLLWKISQCLNSHERRLLFTCDNWQRQVWIQSCEPSSCCTKCVLVNWVQVTNSSPFSGLTFTIVLYAANYFFERRKQLLQIARGNKVTSVGPAITTWTMQIPVFLYLINSCQYIDFISLFVGAPKGQHRRYDTSQSTWFSVVNPDLRKCCHSDCPKLHIYYVAVFCTQNYYCVSVHPGRGIPSLLLFLKNFFPLKGFFFNQILRAEDVVAQIVIWGYINKTWFYMIWKSQSCNSIAFNS